MEVYRLPPASVAVNVTVVAPSENTEGRLSVTVTAWQVSVAVAGSSVTGMPDGLVHSALAFAGAVIAGFVVSTTVAVAVADALLFESSFAVKVTAVAPSG